MFDRSRLVIKPIAERAHDMNVSAVLPLAPHYPTEIYKALEPVSAALQTARDKGAAAIMMIGAHVLRSGVQRYIIDLMERGLISCIAMNGAGIIHEYELALIGATTESVARYVKTGEFGLWRETGAINDVVNAGYRNGIGLGAAVGRHILDGEMPHKETSILAAGARLGIPVTVHVGIGYDIIHEHPNFDGAAAGATSYRDFLTFASVVERLENGVVMNFGSAVMAPEVYLKALSMARNAASAGKREIRRFTTLVCDLHDIAGDYRVEPSKDDRAYYFRPWKTMLARTVADGGKSHYVRGRHCDTVPALWSALTRPLEGVTGRHKIVDIGMLADITKRAKSAGLKVAHCHGCFDLMHPGHIKYFQAARAMGDMLVVTLTEDRFVDKGPGRPVYTQELRAESIASLACVDYVAVNKWATADETLRLLRPDFYVKGQEFEKLEDKTGKIQKEADVAREIGTELRFTHEIVFSSTRLINEHLGRK